MHPFEAALKGAQEVSATVFTISVSLIAVFHPAAADGRHRGPLVREFAVTLLGRHRGFHGGFAYRDSHDVRASLER